jgi:hypothetical protein
MIGNWFEILVKDFGMGMFILALIVIAVDMVIHVRRLHWSEIVFRWMAFLPLGLNGIYCFFMHAFFPAVSAQAIGWTPSPFQFEVAVADLAVGVLGILCFKAGFGFRLATTIAAVFMLWGDAVGHIYQMLVHNNFSAGNAGSWFWLDILVPLILIVCIQKMRPRPIM